MKHDKLIHHIKVDPGAPMSLTLLAALPYLGYSVDTVASLQPAPIRFARRL